MRRDSVDSRPSTGRGCHRRLVLTETERGAQAAVTKLAYSLSPRHTAAGRSQCRWRGFGQACNELGGDWRRVAQLAGARVDQILGSDPEGVPPSAGLSTRSRQVSVPITELNLSSDRGYGALARTSPSARKALVRRHVVPSGEVCPGRSEVARESPRMTGISGCERGVAKFLGCERGVGIGAERTGFDVVDTPRVARNDHSLRERRQAHPGVSAGSHWSACPSKLSHHGHMVGVMKLRRVPGWVWLIQTAGVALVMFSWASSGFGQAALLEFGVALLLALPLAFFGVAFQSRVIRTVEQALAELDLWPFASIVTSSSDGQVELRLVSQSSVRSSTQPIDVMIVVTDPAERLFITERRFNSIVHSDVTSFRWPDDFTSGDIREGEHRVRWFIQAISDGPSRRFGQAAETTFSYTSRS